jgi:hypothetical protein
VHDAYVSNGHETSVKPQKHAQTEEKHTESGQTNANFFQCQQSTFLNVLWLSVSQLDAIEAIELFGC